MAAAATTMARRRVERQPAGLSLIEGRVASKARRMSMAYRVSMDELGVTDDNAVFEGATPGDVWRQVAEHLKKTRGIKLPDVGRRIGGDVSPGICRPALTTRSPGSKARCSPPLVNPARDRTRSWGQLIVTRLLEKLRMGQQDPGGDVVPPGGSKSPCLEERSEQDRRGEADAAAADAGPTARHRERDDAQARRRRRAPAGLRAARRARSP